MNASLGLICISNNLRVRLVLYKLLISHIRLFCHGSGLYVHRPRLILRRPFEAAAARHSNLLVEPQ